MSRAKKLYGFTIIELVLAMGFVSVLLIAIAMTVIQIGNIYNRGITLKDVNQAGGTITVELQRSINQTAPFSIADASKDPSSHYVQQEWGGRLCLGQYSYIWNYGADLENTNRNKYIDSENDIIFVKALDPNASYCTPKEDKYIEVSSSEAVELLNVGQHNLAIHSFSISTNTTTTDNKIGQQLYNLEFLIGTNNQTALYYDNEAKETKCRLPDDIDSDPSYCSINQFNILARAGNSVE